MDEDLSSLVTTIGGGFLGGYLIAYFIRRIVKIMMFIAGAIFALLLFLQQQEIITINITKLQSYTEIFTSIVNATTNTTSTNHFPLVSMLDNLGIPLSSSISAGFILGIMRRG
jgi:uncharacterized membrane protein (Fun14 family)